MCCSNDRSRFLLGSSHISGKVGALVEINCETDFVTKNDSFLAMAKAAAELIVKHKPADLSALGQLAYSQDGFGPTLEEVRKGLIGKIGENMSFRRFKLFDGAAHLTSYLHGTRIGVMVEFEGDESAARDVAMHVAAMKPVALTSADVPAELIEKERSVASAKAAESGKPAEIIAKMVDGSVKKFAKENALLSQLFVMDNKTPIADVVAKAGKEDGFWLHGGTAIVAPTGEIVAKATTEEDEVIAYDCDMDALLFVVEQEGRGACHTGERTCFFVKAEGVTTR